MIDGREQETVLNLKREVWPLTEGQSEVGPITGDKVRIPTPV